VRRSWAALGGGSEHASASSHMASAKGFGALRSVVSAWEGAGVRIICGFGLGLFGTVRQSPGSSARSADSQTRTPVGFEQDC